MDDQKDEQCKHQLARIENDLGNEAFYCMKCERFWKQDKTEHLDLLLKSVEKERNRTLQEVVSVLDEVGKKNQKKYEDRLSTTKSIPLNPIDITIEEIKKHLEGLK